MSRINRESFIVAAVAFLVAGTGAQAEASPSSPPIDWVPYGEGSVGFVMPRGWKIDISDGHVLVLDPGPSGACLVRKLAKVDGETDAIAVVNRAVEPLADREVLSRVNGARHAAVGVRGKADGQARWSEVVADIARNEDGSDVLKLVVFQTTDRAQYERFAEQEAAEVFLESFHTPLWPPAEVFMGTWEGSEGRAARKIAAAGTAKETPLDDSWWFRLELLEGNRYRLTRAHVGAGSVVSGWSSTVESGTFEVNANALALHRRLCAARRASGGRPEKAGPCSSALGTLLLVPKPDSEVLVAHGVHLFDDSWGTGDVALARPNP